MAEVILWLKDRELSRHALGTETRIGRDVDNEVRIDNVGVSRHHATIVRDGNAFVVRDQESANGIHVNGQRVSQHALQDGDVVQIGKFSLQLHLAGNGAPVSPPVERSLRPPRDMAKTLALAPKEVQELVAAQQAARSRAPAPNATEESDGSLKTLLIGLLSIAVVATISYFVLID